MLNSPAPLLRPTTTPGLPLGPLAGCAQRTVVLTATLLGGYTDELFNILFRLEPRKLVREGFEYGESGVRASQEPWVARKDHSEIEPADSACSDGRVTKCMRSA